MTMTVRQLNEFDGKLLTRLVELEKAAFGDGALNEWHLVPMIRHGRVYAAWLDGEAVGLIQYMRDWERPQRAYLVGVSIDEAQRGKGFGTELIRVSAEQLRGGGINEIELTVDPANAAAIRVYAEKLGFYEDGIRPAEYGVGEDRLVMVLELQ